jgi:hypothetical protein
MKVNSKNRGFVEGTLVLMADGKEKAIEQIQTGDMVLSFDEYDADAPLEAMKVINTFSRIDNEILEVKVGKNILKVAKDQMFIGPHNDWKEVYNHSLVVDLEGTPIKYTVNQNRKGKHRVYDITVDENHSLIANSIRVHNAFGSSATRADGSTGGNSAKGYGASSGSQARAGNDPSGLGSTSKSTGSVKSSNTKGTSTTTNSKTQNSNAGKTSGQSANNSMGRGGGGDSRGQGQGGQNNGVNNLNQKVNNSSNGFKKKPKKSKEEPTPTKLSGAAVGTKLIETVEDSVNVLQELISSFTPAELTTAKLSIQAAVDIISNFTNQYVSAMYVAEIQISDKTAHIAAAFNIMNLAREARYPFEETTVSAAGKNMALIYLTLMEAEVIRIKGGLTKYVTADTKGGLTVSVNGVPNSKKKYSNQVRRNKYGKWTIKDKDKA